MLLRRKEKQAKGPVKVEPEVSTAEVVESPVSTAEVKESSEEKREEKDTAPLPLWKIILTWAARIALGGSFIFSGFAKAIDPWGTIYKLEEYFQVMHMPLLMSICLPLSFLLFTVEFMTGVFVLLGCYRQKSIWVAAAFMVLFLPLTLWIWISNPVAECGCFGDALPLSNALTFWKNVVLSGLVVWLFLYNRRIRYLIAPALQWVAFSLTVLFIVAIGWVGYYYQPLIDFRPYPVGTYLPENDEASDEDEEMIGIYERDGEQIRLPLDSIPDDSWEFVGREMPQKPAEETKENLTALFDPEDDSDVTAEVIKKEGDQLMVFFSSLKDVSPATFYRLNSLYNYAQTHGAELTGVASATPKEILSFRDLSLAEYPIYLADDTWIKQMVRGNPGVVMLRDGRILWKSTLSAMAPEDFMSGSAPKDASMFARNNSSILSFLSWTYCTLMALLILVSFVPMVVRKLNARKPSRFVKNAAMTLLIASGLSLTSCSSEGDGPGSHSKPAESATLIYMVANNSLQFDSNNDIAEILEGCKSIDINENKVYLFIASPYYTKGLYRVKKSKGVCSLSLVREYDTETSSVDPSQMTQVFNDFYADAKADACGLFLWSHATGWLPGVNTPQKSYGDDNDLKIDIEQLADAIPEGMFHYLWFDCCLMGGIESCYQLRNKCDRIVCSPTEIMSEGAPYQIILPYVAQKEPRLIEGAAAEYEYYCKSANESLGFTIAVVDCSKLDALAEAAREIVYPEYPYISTAGLQRYGSLQLALPDNQTVRIYYYDLGQTFDTYAEKRGISADSFNKTVAEAVIYKAATPRFGSIAINPEHFSGLSVYVPLSPDAAGYNAYVESFYNTLAWTKALTATD